MVAVSNPPSQPRGSHHELELVLRRPYAGADSAHLRVRGLPTGACQVTSDSEERTVQCAEQLECDLQFPGDEISVAIAPAE